MTCTASTQTSSAGPRCQAPTGELAHDREPHIVDLDCSSLLATRCELSASLNTCSLHCPPFCSPAPRSAHQAVIHKGMMYVFGGEFTSPNQERFHHFKVGWLCVRHSAKTLPGFGRFSYLALHHSCSCLQELWRLDLSTWEWDQLPCKAGPTGRSGHRMAVHKGKVVLFGGYYDNGRDMK